MIRQCPASEVLENPVLPELLDLYKQDGERLQGAEFIPERYYQLEAAGIAKFFSVLNSENEFVGFAVVVINTVPHYRDPVGVVESIFIKKEARRSGLGLDLLTALEAYCRGHARCMYITAPAQSALQKVLPRLGFNLSNLVFLKDFANE